MNLDVKAAYVAVGLGIGLIPANLVLHWYGWALFNVVCIPILLICARYLENTDAGQGG